MTAMKLRGCQMVYFHTKNPTIPLWVFLESLGMENISIFLAIWNTLCKAIWYSYVVYGHFVILWSFGIYLHRFGIPIE
jgi:energy-coupling factor transporter transmembrane protein EcfT